MGEGHLDLEGSEVQQSEPVEAFVAQYSIKLEH